MNTELLFTLSGFAVAAFVGFMYNSAKSQRDRAEQELREYKQRMEYNENRARTKEMRDHAQKERETYESLRDKYFSKYGYYPDDHQS